MVHDFTEMLQFVCSGFWTFVGCLSFVTALGVAGEAIVGAPFNGIVNAIRALRR
jgi:hypothetical protein